jgi:hypothetical protein
VGVLLLLLLLVSLFEELPSRPEDWTVSGTVLVRESTRGLLLIVVVVVLAIVKGED